MTTRTPSMLTGEVRAIIMCYNLTQNKTMTLPLLAEILLDELKARGLDDLVVDIEIAAYD